MRQPGALEAFRASYEEADDPGIVVDDSPLASGLVRSLAETCEPDFVEVCARFLEFLLKAWALTLERPWDEVASAPNLMVWRTEPGSGSHLNMAEGVFPILLLIATAEGVICGRQGGQRPGVQEAVLGGI